MPEARADAFEPIKRPESQTVPASSYHPAFAQIVPSLRWSNDLTIRSRQAHDFLSAFSKHPRPAPYGSAHADTITISVNSPQRGERQRQRSPRKGSLGGCIAASGDLISTRDGFCVGYTTFASLLPIKPYCADAPIKRLMVRPREIAILRPHIQFNWPRSLGWLLFDIDRRDALFASEDAVLPIPTVTMVNPQNGHAHFAYRLKSPVTKFSPATSALRYYAAVERGIRRRLDADPHYSGLIAKNPLSDRWRVTWGPPEPYNLSDLAGWLFDRDMRPEASVAQTTGTGRNCIVFDDVRAVAYQEIVKFKNDGGSLEGWYSRCQNLALGFNRQFENSLPASEIRSISKSIALWTWRNFNEDAFLKRQSVLGKRGMASRWAGHVSAEETEPWKQKGISRRTWYRWQKAAKNNPPG